jgi:hypothetical protein
MSIDVFISYPHQDKVVADAACAKLEAEGIRCWIAPRDVSPGTEWAAAIIDAIDNCRVMILIFSSSANGSKQVHREVQQAFDGGKPVVPVRIEDVTPEKSLRYYMGPVHWLDALTPPLEWHLQRLTQSVGALLRATEPVEETKIEARGRVSQHEPQPVEQARRREDEKQSPREETRQSHTSDEPEAVEFNPKLAAPYKGRGFWWHKGTPDRAIADCTEAIRLNPEDCNEYYNRGFAWWQKGDPDQAIVDWTEAIRLDPKYADAYNNRGTAWWQKGDSDRAIADWTEAIRLDPKHAPAHFNRGLAKMAKGDRASGNADIANAKIINPNI